MEAGLKCFADHLKEQMRASEEYVLEDPRSDEEKSLAAAALVKLMRCQAPPAIERKYYLQCT